MSEEHTSRFDAAVTAMTLPENRFDVTIICTTDDHQAAFWMSKLDHPQEVDGNGETSPFPMVLAVSEDWGGSGAGNGLGTLYAWTKACAYAKTHKKVDLELLLGDGTISASLYHTAGKGTRMAPLPASENNNKPGVVRCAAVAVAVAEWQDPWLRSHLVSRVPLWHLSSMIIRVDRNSPLSVHPLEQR
jgi:hypothetical protein